MPLIPMLIIPFAELLIPIYVRLGLMPTTFQSKKDKVRLTRLEVIKHFMPNSDEHKILIRIKAKGI